MARKYIPTPEEIPSGMCECGCGLTTNPARVTETRKRWFKGHPMPYRTGHSPSRFTKGSERWNWKGGVTNNYGYVLVLMPDHPQARADGYVLEHRLIMERKLGRPLQDNEDVHHINGVKNDNREENLVVLTKTDHHKLHGYPGRKPTSEECSLGGKRGSASRWGKQEK